MQITHLLGGVLLLSSTALAALRHRPVAPSSLRLVATDRWTLDQLCRGIGVMLRVQPIPGRLTIDLTHLTHLDASSLTSLDYACKRWTKRGGHVTIEGCTRETAEALSRRWRDANPDQRPRPSAD